MKTTTQTKQTQTTKSGPQVDQDEGTYKIEAVLNWASVRKARKLKKDDADDAPLYYQLQAVYKPNSPSDKELSALLKANRAIKQQAYDALVTDEGVPTNNPTIGVSTGDLVFPFKKRQFSDDQGHLNPPFVLDKNNNPIPEGILIGNGSKALIEFKIRRYPLGATIDLVGIKVLELVEYVPDGKGKRASHSFGVPTGKPLYITPSQVKGKVDDDSSDDDNAF